ncbi:protein da1-related 2, partial [Phtheirospermum japonicum]
TQPQKLIHKCEVTSILVLYGLSRLLIGAIPAHELMHGWLRLNGYRNLAPEVEEGICQVLSHMWLDSEVLPETRHMPSTSSALTSMSSTSSSSSYWSSSKKGGRSSVENKLGEFFMHQIEHDASSAYGRVYRAAMSAVNKYGLRRTLDHIRYTGTFPE